ncbi:MAG: GHKL domain-containing protein [Bacteroidetes bacterium]|nr:GHKL domain-containing protein [Bacteroidota bacterium]
MTKLYKNNFRLLQIGLIILLISVAIDFLQNQLIPDLNDKYQLHRIQKDVNEKEETCLKLFNYYQSISADSYYENLDKTLEIAKEEKIFFYIFQNGQLVLWTSNKVIPNKIVVPEDKLRLQLLANGYYLQLNRYDGEYLFTALIPVESAYPYENNYLKNNFLLGKSNDHFKIDKTESEELKAGNYHVKDINNEDLFMLKPLPKDEPNFLLLILYLLTGIIIFIYINRQILRLFEEKRSIHAYILTFTTLLITFLGWKVFVVPKELFSHQIFQPIVYASSEFLGSIGDLFMTVFLLSWMLFIITKQFRFKIKASKKINALLLIVLFFFTLLLITSISTIIRGMVMNSSIPMDMSEFFRFNFYSILAFFIVFLLLFIFLAFTSIFVRIVRIKQFLWWQNAILFIIPSFLYFIIFRYHFSYSYLLILFPIIVWILFTYYGFLENLNLNSLLAFILISAGFAAHQIISANENKEQENRKLLITSIATDRDALGEQLILDEIDKIQNDDYVKSFYSNPLISKALLKKRLKQIYFSGYFSNFDLILNTYSPKGEPFKSNTYIPYSNYLTVIEQCHVVDSNALLYFRNTFDGAPVYIIKLKIEKHNKIVGNLVLELKKKPFLEESVYPELIIEHNIRRQEEIKNYSYAIYINNLLSNQKGEYSYPITFDSKQNGAPYYFFNDKKYDHLFYNMNDGVSIIMSKPVNNVFTSLALFSVLFILSTLLLAIGYYLVRIINNLGEKGIRSRQFWSSFNPIPQMYFKGKIQGTILVSILVALLLTGFATIRFISLNSSKNTEIKLQKEIKIVKESLSNYFNQNSVYGEDLYAKIIQAADLFRTDINIFDRYGVLTATSQIPVYERKIISQMIDAEAFYKLWILQKSQLVQYEKIGGKIKYLSAYSPIRDGNNEIIGFINLPYFAKEKETKEEITNLIVTIVNIYVFLFLLIILISIIIANTFTEPLEIIKKHLSDIQLGKTNKKISWNSSDEIGSLIAEYNQMLVKVEESAAVLARSERESAWREMAKQVAHEIKNPLTPMKLNLQQLLRAWETKDEDLEERFKKTTQILINRIDTLSNIATEFSAFARMPEANQKVVLIDKILKEVAHFYQSTDKIIIDLDLHTDDIKILGDESQLNRAFNNLVRNAFQATPEDREAKVIISSEHRDDQVIIGIKDNGNGIPEELKDKIFLPNFSTKSSGMGLGLAIVKRIINSANGHIWFDTEENIGTTFYISFPVDENSVDKIEDTEI